MRGRKKGSKEGSMEEGRCKKKGDREGRGEQVREECESGVTHFMNCSTQ